MGGNGKKFWIDHNEIIDKSKSFSIQLGVKKNSKNYYSSKGVFESINRVLDEQNIITKDFVYENGESTYVTDYLIFVTSTVFKIIKGDKEVLDVFVKVACHISRGGKLEVIGKNIDKIKSVKNLTPFINESKNQIIGNVIYIDNYGNVVTNITKPFFREISKSRDFEISVRNYKFKKIHSKYSDIVNFSIDENRRNNDGQALAIFNSSLNLEIAIYKSNPVNFGTAASLMGLNILDSVTINFK